MSKLRKLMMGNDGSPMVGVSLLKMLIWNSEKFIVFWFDRDESMFQVSAYGITGCVKDIQGPVTSEQTNKYGAAMAGFDSSCPHFELHLKKYHRARVGLQKEFCKKAELMGKDVVILEYEPTQRSSIVWLDDHSIRYKSFRVELAIGWTDFKKENKLQYGRTYFFAYNRARNVIQVQPVNVRRENVINDSTDCEEEDDEETDSEEWNQDQRADIHGRVIDEQRVKNVAGSPHDEFVLKKWQTHRLPLHKKFAKKAHLLDKETVILEYAATRQSTEVLLLNRSCPYYYRLELAKGWNNFRKENGLEFRETYSLACHQTAVAL